MKLLPFFDIALCFLAHNLNGQNRARFHHILYRDRIYKFPDVSKLTPGQIEQVEMNKIKLVYVTKDGKIKYPTICSNRLFCVITLESKVPTVDFWQIRSKDDPFVGKDTCINSSTPLPEGGKFIIDFSRPTVGSPTYVASVPFEAWTFGVGTIPFRIRLPVNNAPITTSANISFAGSFGKTYGLSRINSRAIHNYSVTLGGFVGLSSADIKKTTVNDVSKYIQDQTNLAISYGLSLTLARNNLGFVVTFGADNSIGDYSNIWLYQNKPWIGFGINTGLGLF